MSGERNGASARRPWVDELVSLAVESVIREAQLAGMPVSSVVAAIAKKLLATLNEQAGRDHAERDHLAREAAEFGEKVRRRRARGEHWSAIERDIGLSLHILRAAGLDDAGGRLD